MAFVADALETFVELTILLGGLIFLAQVSQQIGGRVLPRRKG